jgi:2-hydroxychromene-2-carboxylate isomerase
MARQLARLPAAPAVFYYDLGCPTCYLAAERIMAVLPVVPAWEPVSAELFGGIDPEPARAEIQALAGELGLQRFRWPHRWPPETRRAMLAVTFAKRIGRGVAFSLAAFRQTFAAGRDLDSEDTLALAAAACEIHPTALLMGIGLRNTQEALGQACARARAEKVKSLPTVQVGSQIFEGYGCVEEAAAVFATSE